MLHSRLTSAVESKFVMDAKLQEMELIGQITPAGQLGEEETMYIACTPAKETSQHYIKWFDEGTRKLRESGRLAAIMAKYGLSDWR